MEERDRSRSPSRKTSRVEQVVGRWLRRSRDSTSRERVLEESRVVDNGSSDQRSFPIRVTVQLPRDPSLQSHGFTVATDTPLLVHEVIPGGPADGKLMPGDQPLKINNVAVDDLSAEQAADLIRECQDVLTITVLRITVGPKSSFITPEKRAQLRSNPVKVRFAEEVVVNGHSQGNSLLFLPNVLKVYLENGQTKAFKFEPKTRVKDIVMTLKEKLSIMRIEHFSLLLEQQYSITKLLLLHEDELIQQVVEKKETHDYRCLFRVCFMPRDPQDLLDEDPVAFEYLYLQCVSDVLQERYAVEMKCNTALRLAALHIQERLASTGQSPKTHLKTITKEWGIESFVSNTLLRNMREKDLRKAISYHMKKSIYLEPKQKVISLNQARLNYLYEMAELKSYGGKSFSATMLLQDRESMVSLLVGVQYGVSQVVNHKLSVINTLTEFSGITRVELIPESERVSLVKIYLQDIKPITLLLESVAAKDLSCLVAGYCRALVNPNVCVFPWNAHRKSPRISAEEGYVSHCGSDSEDSDTDVDALLAHVASATKRSQQRSADSSSSEQTSSREGQEGEQEQEEVEEEDTQGTQQEETQDHGETEEEGVEAQGRDGESSEGASEWMEEQRTSAEGGEVEGADGQDEGMEVEGGGQRQAEGGGEERQRCYIMLEEPASEASDSGRTDSRLLASLSSDSMDALEEDDLLTLCSTRRPCHLSVGHAHNNPPPSPRSPHSTSDLYTGSVTSDGEGDPFLCYAALSNMVDCLPSPPEASEDEDEAGQGLENRGLDLSKLTPLSAQESSVFTFEQCDARHYYNICSNVTPDSARSLPRPLPERQEEEGEEEEEEVEMEPVPILQPPPGFGDSSSDDEFFDAQERLTSPEQPSSANMTRENSMESSAMKRTLSLSDISVCVSESDREGGGDWREHNEQQGRDSALCRRKSGKQRRSYLETDYTSLVSYPEQNHRPKSPCNALLSASGQEPAEGLNQTPCLTVCPLTNTEAEPAELEDKSITSLCGRSLSNSLAEQRGRHRRHLSAQVEMEVEPDAMENKAVTDLLASSISAVRRSATLPAADLRACRRSEMMSQEGLLDRLAQGPFASHLFFRRTAEISAETDGDREGEGEGRCDSPRPRSFTLGHVDSPTSPHPPQVIPTISYTPSPDTEEAGELAWDAGQASSSSSPSPSLMEAFRRGLTVSRDSLTEAGETDELDGNHSTQEPTSTSTSSSTSGFLLSPCSPGSMIGRLSASTLRGKIQSLPLYLSRSQEALSESNGADAGTPQRRRFSEASRCRRADRTPPGTLLFRDSAAPEVTEVKVVTIVSEEVTEVIEEMVEVGHRGPGTQQRAETKDDSPISSQEEAAKAEQPVSTGPPSSVVVTTQNLPNTGPHTANHTHSHTHTAVTGCGLFRNCESRPTDTQPQALPSPCPHGKPELGCRSALALGCEVLVESAQAPLEVCDCQAVYTNCFSGVLDSSSFDDELTVYEFSCRTKSDALVVSPVSAIPPLPLSSSPFSPSSSSSSSSPLPSFPCPLLPPSSSTELSPLLSPLEPVNCFLSDPEEEAIATLLARRYPSPPAGFAALQRDLETLSSLLGGAVKSREHECESLEHHRDSCAAHFSENKRRLHEEARGLLAGCQRVVRAGQTAEETLQALALSFRALVQLASVCLGFSSCPRCRERHGQALAGLADVARTYREFAHTAECAGSAAAATGKRSSCHDLSIKLLARQCTALTTSVFCLTQLFRTLTTL